MKILYLSSNKFDYLQDLVYSGLVKTIGAENIQPAFFNSSYFLNVKKYPKNLGFNSGNIIHYLKNQFLKFDYDTVIVASAKKLTFELYCKIADKIPQHCPVVFLDGGDRAEIGGDLTRIGFPTLFKEAQKKRPFDLIFKREMLKNRDYNSNVFPCPFAFNLDRIKNVKEVSEKKYDVSFWAGETHDSRKKVFSLLEGKYDCDENGTSRNNTLYNYKRRGDFYFEELKRCKITLNLRGVGWDTLRFWEIPAVGSFMLSQKLNIIIPNDFKDGVNIVTFKNDFTDFFDKIDYYLENDAEREKIALEGFKHLCNYHTDIIRAKYILKKIKAL